jgi:hypothetical protein
MTRYGDELDEMKSHLGATSASSSAGEQDDVARFLVEFRALGDGPVPPPSPEVVALLGGATPLRPWRRHRRRIARTLLLAAAVVAALVVAAASHSLPQAAQRVVVNVVNNLSPFKIEHQPPPVRPAPTRSRHLLAPGGSSSSPGHGTKRTQAPGGAATGGAVPGRPGGATRPGGTTGSDDRSDRFGSTRSGGSDDGTASSAPSPSRSRDDGSPDGADGGGARPGQPTPPPSGDEPEPSGD